MARSQLLRGACGPRIPLDVSAQPPLVAATCVAAGVPSLSSAALGGDCSLDSATVSFLVRLAVGAQAELDRRKRREEEEKAKKAKEAKESSKQFLDQLRATAWRELEERLDSGGAFQAGRGRRGGRGGRLVLPLFLAALVVDNGSGLLAMLVSLVTLHLALCSPSVDARPKMLCIMAGMHQEDSCAVSAGDDAPRAVPSRFHRCSSWTFYWPVVCNDRFSGPGAVLGQVLTCPVLCLTGAALGQGCRARCMQRQALVFQTVQKTCGGPAGAAHHHGHPHPRRGAEFDPHGSDCSADHRDSTVAVPRQGVDMPVVGPHRCKLCSFFMVFHRCSFGTRLSCPLCARQMP